MILVEVVAFSSFAKKNKSNPNQRDSRLFDMKHASGYMIKVDISACLRAGTGSVHVFTLTEGPLVTAGRGNFLPPHRLWSRIRQLPGASPLLLLPNTAPSFAHSSCDPLPGLVGCGVGGAHCGPGEAPLREGEGTTVVGLAFG